MKKFIGWLIIGLLFAGTVCGVYFGISYYSLDIDTALEEEYDKGYSDALNGSESNYMTLYQQALEDLQIAQSDKSELQSQLENALNENSDNQDLIQNLRNQLSSKDNEIDALEDTVTLYQLMFEAYEDIDKLQVTFVLFDNGDETPYDVQFIDENECLSAVVAPTASDFEGWSLTKGGELIDDITTMQVTENMTIYGMFTNTVTFMVNGEEYTTQEVSYNQYSSDVDISLNGYNFNGWSLTENGETITLSTTPITVDTTFYAVLEKLDFATMSWNGFSDIDGRYIWHSDENTYYSYNTEQYVLNKETFTWEEKTWEGLTSFVGDNVWTDGENIYYLYAGNQYILDENASTWNEQELVINNDNLYGCYVWSDGVNFYNTYSGNTFYLVDYIDSDSQWVPSNSMNFPGSFIDIWTDGENIYSSYGSQQYVYDKVTSNWQEKVWNGLSSFNGSYVWTDGENIFYSCGRDFQYVLNKETSTWEEKTWSGPWLGFTSLNGSYVWTDGENIYYSDGNEQYILF